MATSQFYTRTQKLAALQIALEDSGYSMADYAYLRRSEKLGILNYRASILRTSFAPVCRVTVHPEPRLV